MADVDADGQLDVAIERVNSGTCLEGLVVVEVRVSVSLAVDDGCAPLEHAVSMLTESVDTDISRIDSTFLVGEGLRQPATAPELIGHADLCVRCRTNPNLDVFSKVDLHVGVLQEELKLS